MASETTMKLWDHWRKRIADGCTNSSPRDWFENEIDDRDERIAELEARTRRVTALLNDAWAEVQAAGFYGSDSSSLVDGVRWLASGQTKLK